VLIPRLWPASPPSTRSLIVEDAVAPAGGRVHRGIGCGARRRFVQQPAAVDHASLCTADRAAAVECWLRPEQWGSIVNRDGKVCAVAFTGADRGAQWPGSRVIAAQKAYTANAFSLPGLALSTANLYFSNQPGSSLFGLQFSNPVDPKEAYDGEASNFGTSHDPMVNTRVGGVNVFGGGLALYAANGDILGAVGVSGDSSCADHNIAWRTRANLRLDYVPAGVSGNASRPDNIVYDIVGGQSASGWGHPHCVNPSGETSVANSLPAVRKILIAA